MCETPHVVRNSTRCDDVNWGPPSDHTIPYHVWNSCTGKVVPQCSNEFWRCGIFAHIDDIRPIGHTVNVDEELSTTMVSKVKSDLLKGLIRNWFAYQLLFAISW